jgi:hypothetical protein
MKTRTVIATITLAALPFVTGGFAQSPDINSSGVVGAQSTDAATTSRGPMRMMNWIEEIKKDLVAPAGENDAAAIHAKLAHDKSLLERFEAQMQSMQNRMNSMISNHSMMSGGMISAGMMSGQVSNCPHAGQQGQK